jgi:hypothetical protein
MVGGTKGHVHEAELAAVVSDAAWHDVDVAFRAWASAPTGDRYRAFLDADRRWREMAGTADPGSSRNGGRSLVPTPG